MDLTFNKVAAAVLMTGLAVMGLNELSHQAFRVEHHDQPGYLIEVPEAAVAGGPAMEEGPRDYFTLISTADLGNGEAQAAKCVQCHSLEQGGEMLQGPPLWGVVGRDIAAWPGFDFTQGETGLAGLEGDWDYVQLDKFIEAPKRYVPGTAMNFVGIRREKDRLDLIAYLRTLEAPAAVYPMPEPLPAAADVPADAAAAVEGAEGTTPGAVIAGPGNQGAVQSEGDVITGETGVSQEAGGTQPGGQAGAAPGGETAPAGGAATPPAQR
jgi:cytochrome c